MIQFKNVTKFYGPKKALDNINVTFEDSKVIGLLGSNGSGKTTLIKLISGLIPLSKGEILVDGMNISYHTKNLVSYLPERTYLDNTMKVMDTIHYFEDFYSDFDSSKATRLLTDLNVPLDAKLSSLSKGTKEKVQLILVISRNAKYFILDEPIAGVDPIARDYIINMIMNERPKDSTLIISTHLIKDIESILEEVIFISKGKIILSDTSDNLINQYGSVDSSFKEVFKCL